MKQVVLFVVAAIVISVAWYLWMMPPQAVRSFVQEGVLVRDTPGLVPGIWYLSYEDAGAPGQSVQLIFDVHTKCSVADTATSCGTLLVAGQRAHITGVVDGAAVRVTELLAVGQPPETGVSMQLYYYDAARDTDDAGNILCSAQGLVSVERVLPQDATVEDAVQLLLRGEISDEERVQGVTSEFPLSGVALVSASSSDGVLTLTFVDPENKTSGGACRAGILWAQIEATVRQFSGASEVRFAPGDIFQP